MVNKRNIRKSINKLEVSASPVSSEEVEKKLNSIDTGLQEILIKGEKMLHQKQDELLSAELQELKAKQRYWAKLWKAISGVTHKEMRRVWKHQENINWNLSE